VRAVTKPYPGAFTFLPRGEKLYIWWALPEKGSTSKSSSGTIEIEEDNVYVRAPDGRLRLLDIEVGKETLKGKKIFEFFKKQEGRILK
jgi:methionyl-tRNA formyltransferase